MKIESHIENLQESINEIEKAIEVGLSKKQRTIGFHTSAACVDMLEILLHKENLISPGHLIKHEWFLSKAKTAEKFSFDFPKKEKILKLIKSIEEKRNILCYGKRQKEDILEELISEFNELKNIFIELRVLK